MASELEVRVRPPVVGGGVSLAFTQNEREEVRYVGTDGNCAVALSAESGSHQQNYIFE